MTYRLQKFLSSFFEPAPVSAITPVLMDIDVQALGGRLMFLAPFSGPGGPVTLLSAIMGVNGAVWQPLGPVMLLSAIMGVYGAVRRPWGAGDVAMGVYGDVVGP